MGDIAAATAGNADFGEELRAAFEHRHFGIGRGLGAGDGGKKTRRAAADHNDPSRTHAHEFNQVSRQSLFKPQRRGAPGRCDNQNCIVSAGTPELSGRAFNYACPLPHECGVPPQCPVAP